MTDGALSPRMEEICQLVVRHGLSYSEVADRLGISASTVDTYVTTIGARLRMKPQHAMREYYFQVMLHRDGAEDDAA